MAVRLPACRLSHLEWEAVEKYTISVHWLRHLLQMV